MNDPNFIIGGAAASGTSFLSEILIQHPNIFLPKNMRPEPHFFYKSWEFKKGIKYYRTKWFSDSDLNHIAIGERSSSYLFGSKQVAEKIHAFYPNMRFIFILRNPIERVWANYRYTVLEGLETNSFQAALLTEKKRIKKQKGIWSEIQPFNYTGRSFYAKQIKEFLKIFSKKNILLIKSEKLSLNTDVELKKICNFLNVSDNFKYKLAPLHTSLSVVDRYLQKNLRQYFKNDFDVIVEIIRKKENLKTFPNYTKHLKKIKSLSNNLEKKKIKMPQSCRNFLRYIFENDIQELKSLVDFDVNDWI